MTAISNSICENFNGTGTHESVLDSSDLDLGPPGLCLTCEQSECVTTVTRASADCMVTGHFCVRRMDRARARPRVAGDHVLSAPSPQAAPCHLAKTQERTCYRACVSWNTARPMSTGARSTCSDDPRYCLSAKGSGDLPTSAWTRAPVLERSVGRPHLARDARAEADRRSSLLCQARSRKRRGPTATQRKRGAARASARRVVVGADSDLVKADVPALAP